MCLPTGVGNRSYAPAAYYSQFYRKGFDEQRGSLLSEPQCSHGRDACGASSRKTELPHAKRGGQSRGVSGITSDQRLARGRGNGRVVPYSRPLSTAIDRSNAKLFSALELLASDEEARPTLWSELPQSWCGLEDFLGVFSN